MQELGVGATDFLWLWIGVHMSVIGMLRKPSEGYTSLAV